MMRPPDSNNSNRFSGGVRHYHRVGGGERGWDDWVEGDGFKPKKRRNWWRIIGVLLSVAALGGIIAGLIIELR